MKGYKKKPNTLTADRTESHLHGESSQCNRETSGHCWFGRTQPWGAADTGALSSPLPSSASSQPWVKPAPGPSGRTSHPPARLGGLRHCSQVTATPCPPTVAGTNSSCTNSGFCRCRPPARALPHRSSGEDKSRSLNSTSGPCSPSPRANRGGCPSSSFLLLTGSSESRRTSPARSLNDSPVTLSLQRRAHK